MPIEIQSRESLVNVSYKVPHKLKNEIEKIAKSDGVAQGEIVRAFLEYAKREFHEGDSKRVWGDQMMTHFRKQIQVGDKVLASGIVGHVRQILKPTQNGQNPTLFRLEVAGKVEIWVIGEVITDILPREGGNLRENIVQEMTRYQKRLKGPIVKP